MNKLKLIITMFMFIFLTGIYLNGYFVFNTTENTFGSNSGSDNVNDGSSTSLGQLVIEGAGYFLQSNSDYQLFLKKVELSGIDAGNTVEIQAALDSAIKNMELAKETYYKILQLANTLDYNPTVLEKLRYFDYNGYREKYNLNIVIFRQVEELLKSGDVRGCYQKCYHTFGVILARLRAVKANAETANVTDIPACWRVNQLYLEIEFFGQYASEVFMNIK